MTLRRNLAVLAGVAVLAASGTAFAVTNGGTDDTTVSATFTDASPLVTGNLVKMDGVQVGQISAIDLENGQAKVQLKLDRSVLPLHQDAHATIRPVTLLGERYIDLDRGSDNQPLLGSPARIDVQHTGQSVDLDQILNSLDDPTSTALAALVTTAGEGAGGQGKNIDAALKALAPAMNDTGQLGTILDQQNDLLKHLLDTATPIAQSLANGQGADLDKLVDSSTQTLSAVTAQQQGLESTLQQLPDTLRKAQATLAQVAGVANSATPVLASVRPVTDNLPQITSELDAFSASANPALGSLPQVLDHAKDLLDQAAPLVRDLQPAGGALQSASTSARPIVGDLTHSFTSVFEFIKGWALSTNGRDALSNYFRAFVVDTPKALLNIPGTSVGPAQPAAPQPAAAPANAAPQLPGLPALPGLPGLPAPQAPASTTQQDGTSATGLSQQQESSLLGQLLGGS